MNDHRERLTTRICSPEGPLDSPICLIGQAPGATEDYKGLPFKGAAGKLLDRVLHNIGFARSLCLVNNVFRQRPPDNDVGYYFTDKSKTKLTWEGQEHVDALKSWLEDLLRRREAGLGGPNVIVALGREAMLVLTGRKRIEKWRGSVLPCTLVPGFKVYCTYHPSYVNRLMNEPEEKLLGRKKTLQQNALPLFTIDLERAVFQSDFPEIRTPQREFKLLLDSPTEILAELNNLHSAKYVAVDIETLAGIDGPILWCIGFAPSPDYAICIPFIRHQRLAWNVEVEADIVTAISELFLDPNVIKIFQGGSYDLSVLGRYYGLRVADGTYADTMVLHQHTYPFLRKGLEVLTSIYTWEPYYKDDGKVWDGRRTSDRAEFEYNCRDCCVTREVYPIIWKDSADLHLTEAYNRSMEIFPSLLHMQIRGVKIDVAQKAQLSIDYAEASAQAQQTVNVLAGQEVNLNSSAQVNALLYGRYNMPIQYNHKTKKPAADKDALNRLIKKYHNPNTEQYQILNAILDFRKFDKLHNTYTEMVIDSDGRVRTSYGWISTLRLNSYESPFGTGGNLQNIPTRTEEGKAIRKLFIPDEGMELLHSDLAQAEAREVAWLAGDGQLIELFQTPGYDVHWFRAKMIFSLPDDLEYNPTEEITCPYLDEPKPMKFYRNLGKTIVHAFNYKMGPIMLQTILIREGVFIPVNVCRTLLAAATRANPLTIRWQNNVVDTIKATGMLETPLGDRRMFRGRQNDAMWRSAVAYVPQSTVGRILQLGIAKLYRESDTYEILLNVHDEVGGQGLPENRMENMRAIKEALEIPHKVNGRELVIPCDFKYSSKSWGDLEEIAYGSEN